MSAPERPAVAVTGLGLWMAGYPSVAAWSERAPDPSVTRPDGRAFDRVNRRRAGVLGRAIADAAAEAMQQARTDFGTIAIVVGSSIGEASTMVGLLDQMWRLETPMSPAAFTVSVHNAASGLLSISNRNQGFTTSLAADHDTPAAALMEGIGLVLQRGEPALIVCADEPVPPSLAFDIEHWELMAAAVVLAPCGIANAVCARLAVQGSAADAPTLARAELATTVASNPQAGMMDLVDALLRRQSGTVPLDRGAGRGYVARLDFETHGNGAG